MNAPRTRREFLADVARVAIVGGVGPGLAAHLGVLPAWADEDGPAPLTFGALEPLVAAMQDTPPEDLLRLLVERLRTGTPLRTLVAAGALANARTFGGQDYVGYHVAMALGPANRMALASPEAERAVPVLKVLHRNTARIAAFGGRAREVLRAVAVPAPAEGSPDPRETALAAIRAKDVEAAERALAACAARSPEDALDPVVRAVAGGADVHRTVLPSRAWDLLDVVGREHAHTMLRQSLRYVATGRHTVEPEVAAALAGALERHGLLGRAAGTRVPDDDWVAATSRAIFEASAEDAADLAAKALAEGVAPDAVAEATSLATNQLLLRDAGRPEREARPEKPVGSVHGDSIGVHAADAANAWRRLARAGDGRHAFACTILGAYQAARDRAGRGGDFLAWTPRPRPEDLERVTGRVPAALLKEADQAIRAGDQDRAAAAIDRYGAAGGPAPDAFAMLLRHATEADGALHAEKYYATAAEEFETTRPAFRWRQAVALARVAASQSARPAPAVAEARKLLST
jgi:hypothetical protein